MHWHYINKHHHQEALGPVVAGEAVAAELEKLQDRSRFPILLLIFSVTWDLNVHQERKKILTFTHEKTTFRC